jgi:hypothetical protein
VCDSPAACGQLGDLGRPISASTGQEGAMTFGLVIGRFWRIKILLELPWPQICICRVRSSSALGLDPGLGLTPPPGIVTPRPTATSTVHPPSPPRHPKVSRATPPVPDGSNP